MSKTRVLLLGPDRRVISAGDFAALYGTLRGGSIAPTTAS